MIQLRMRTARFLCWLALQLIPKYPLIEPKPKNFLDVRQMVKNVATHEWFFGKEQQ